MPIMPSKAYSNWMTNQDRIKVLMQFYPWAVHEMHDMWPANPSSIEDIFPDSTLREALFKLDSTLNPILGFAIVQMVALFELYMADRYAEALESRLMNLPSTELILIDEYKVRVPEFGNELRAYVAQEQENFARRSNWANRVSTLLEELGRPGSEVNHAVIEEIMNVRNLLIHNGGKVTERFRKRFPESMFTMRDTVRTDQEVLQAMVAILQDVVYELFER
jgi:hypothetical protein